MIFITYWKQFLHGAIMGSWYDIIVEWIGLDKSPMAQNQ